MIAFTFRIPLRPKTEHTSIWPYIDGEYSITFHDSLRIFGPSSLESLCRDFKVKHQKLTETVSHDDITIDNWRECQPELSKYLEHDCKGLLEVMTAFTKEVFKGTGTYQYRTVEDRVRQIFNSLYGSEFNTARSKKARQRGLELDGYNAKVRAVLRSTAHNMTNTWALF